MPSRKRSRTRAVKPVVCWAAFDVSGNYIPSLFCTPKGASWEIYNKNGLWRLRDGTWRVKRVRITPLTRGRSR